MQVQQMAIAHWLLARIAYGESQIYQEDVPVERQLSLLRQVGTERTRLERFFYTALHELQRLQEKREAKAEKQLLHRHPRHPLASYPPVFDNLTQVTTDTQLLSLPQPAPTPPRRVPASPRHSDCQSPKNCSPGLRY